MSSRATVSEYDLKPLTKVGDRNGSLNKFIVCVTCQISGEYFEPFYLELVFKGDKIEVSTDKLTYRVHVHITIKAHLQIFAYTYTNNDILQPTWHTIPVFIPLESLIVKYNKKEINVRKSFAYMQS